jgi:hypothetical protein
MSYDPAIVGYYSTITDEPHIGVDASHERLSHTGETVVSKKVKTLCAPFHRG